MNAARHLNSGNSASASAGPVDDVSLQQDRGPKYIEAGDGRGPKQYETCKLGTRYSKLFEFFLADL